MAQINYDAYKAYAQQRDEGNGGPRIGFFSLKNDGDEAIVRFMFDLPEEIIRVGTHSYKDERGWNRQVNCLRDDPRDPVSKCPMCEAGERFTFQAYIKLIQYVKDENGRVTGIPKIWNRGAGSSTVKLLEDYCNEYSPLSSNIFKIRRCGVAGSRDTTYNIIPANSKLYPGNIYGEVPGAFEGYNVIGSAVKSMSADEMWTILGEPERASGAGNAASPASRTTVNEEQSTDAASYYGNAANIHQAYVNKASGVPNNSPVQETYTPQTPQTPTNSYTRPAPANTPEDPATAGFQRPRRFYS